MPTNDHRYNAICKICTEKSQWEIVPQECGTDRGERGTAGKAGARRVLRLRTPEEGDPPAWPAMGSSGAPWPCLGSDGWALGRPVLVLLRGGRGRVEASSHSHLDPRPKPLRPGGLLGLGVEAGVGYGAGRRGLSAFRGRGSSFSSTFNTRPHRRSVLRWARARYKAAT